MKAQPRTRPCEEEEDRARAGELADWLVAEGDTFPLPFSHLPLYYYCYSSSIYCSLAADGLHTRNSS